MSTTDTGRAHRVGPDAVPVSSAGEHAKGNNSRTPVIDRAYRASPRFELSDGFKDEWMNSEDKSSNTAATRIRSTVVIAGVSGGSTASIFVTIEASIQP